MKLGEVVVTHDVYYNFAKFHQNRMKNKKVLLIAHLSETRILGTHVPSLKITMIGNKIEVCLIALITHSPPNEPAVKIKYILITRSF